MSGIAKALLASVVLSLAAVPPLTAQEGPVFVQVETFDVSPGTSAKFEGAMQKAAEAATQANLAAEFGWSVYQEGNTYRIVSVHKSMGDLDDETVWQKQFVGTPGEAALGEAFQMFGEVEASATSDIAEAKRDWTYLPENGLKLGDQVGAVVFESWVKFGQEQAFDANTKELMALLKEMDFPYPVLGHRVRIGDLGLCSFVVMHDGLDQFYGDKSIDKLIMASNLGEKWGKTMEARNPMMTKTASFNVAYRGDLSYAP